MEIAEGKGSDELLRAETVLWSHILSLIDSMALKCVVELGIPDAVDTHGRGITIAELISSLSLSPTKAPPVRRLMRMLTHSGFFACGQTNGEDVYSLTPLSELLVKSKDTCQSGLVLAVLDPVLVGPLQSMSAWIRGDDATPFSLMHGCGVWDVTDRDPRFNKMFNEGMAGDSRFVVDVLVKKCGQLFRGLKSLMDVGGGTGTTAVAIANAFLEVKCSVLDLPQVVDAVQVNGGVDFIAGDMFAYIPPANAILLKWILHNWSDQKCVDILRRCKEAIPPKEDGGKVIIVDLVVGNDNSHPKAWTSQLYCDMWMMVHFGGAEREEEEWKNIFLIAGFTDYKIMPLGLRSVIEVYP